MLFIGSPIIHGVYLIFIDILWAIIPSIRKRLQPKAHLLPIVAHNAASQLVVEGVGQGEHHLVPIGTQQPLEGIACDDEGQRVVLRLTQLLPPK